MTVIPKVFNVPWKKQDWGKKEKDVDKFEKHSLFWQKQDGSLDFLREKSY